MFNHFLVRLLATFFYVGYIPLGPGTWASLIATIIALTFSYWIYMYLVLFLFFTVSGFIVAGEMEKVAKEKDASCIVIDEVSGAFIAFFMLPSYEWPVLVVTFFLYRAFDMFKIYPANRFEEKGGSFGVMMDDLFAGLYTNIVMQIAIRLAFFM